MTNKAYIAPPILSYDKVFVNYSTKQNLPVIHTTYNVLPDSQNIIKNVENPISAYHGWLDKYSDHDALYDAFIETRNLLMNGKKVNVSAEASIEKNLTVKKKQNINKIKSRIAKKEKIKENSTYKSENLVSIQIEPNISHTPSAKDCEPSDKKFVIDETLSAADVPQDMISNLFTQLLVLDWCEKDDGVRNKNTLFRISKENIAKCFPIMIRLANDLYLAISEKTGALAGFTVEERYNFLFHIIAKGEMMYWQTINDPEFCLYILDQYQPLFTYMRKELNSQ